MSIRNMMGSVGEQETSGRYAELQDAAANEARKYCDNRVITSKYTLITFLPKFLLEAFSKFANTYFLFVSALQLYRPVSTTNGIPYSLVPLMFVLFVEAVALVIEDRTRQRDDRAGNSSKARVVQADGSLANKVWHELRVGDVCKLNNRDGIPADAFILACSDSPPAGVCYVETKSLDGETNLKLRQGVSDVAKLVDDIAAGLCTSSGLEPTDENKHSKYDMAVGELRGTVKGEAVNQHIHQFSGSARLHRKGEAAPADWTPLSINQILLRGCVLRNTDFAYVMLLTTGQDTKIIQNSTTTKGKMSVLDRVINKNILIFVAVELALSIIAAFFSWQWDSTIGINSEYLQLEELETTDYILRAGTFFLLVANMIPVSLYVVMKLSRGFQSLFVSWDLKMSHTAEDPLSGEMVTTKAKVRTMDLNDSLGQVSYIFSDKTGTLTNNIMEFRKCAINGVVYGTGTTVIGAAALQRQGQLKEAAAAREAIEAQAQHPHPRYVNYADGGKAAGTASLVKALKSKKEAATAKEFLEALAICHSVLLERVRDEQGAYTGEVRLSASSPDDQALVAFAKEMGFSFDERAEGGKVVVVSMSNPTAYVESGEISGTAPAEKEKVRFDLLEILEFTSKRKRMSVVIRDPRTNRLRLLCKGADNEVFARLDESNPANKKVIAKTNKDLINFAEDGLRTLVVASRALSDSEFSDWHAKYNAAQSDLGEMEKRKNGQDNKIDSLMNQLESGLTLLGATAIEDKLQDGVPEAISKLADAGIKIWVLTGDKEETAINIGFACQLLSNDMERVIINGNSGKTTGEIGAKLQEALDNADYRHGVDPHAEIALIIDGAALALSLDDRNNRETLFKLASQCQAVVACRTSPSQKSQIVSMVRSFDKTAKTLAIGDGANDVAMIQTAHIGVGISGQEGLQAANSSDYAIAQFAFLERLLLWHGFNNYRRMAFLVVVMFYKNIVLILAQLIWTGYAGFSGQKFYLELALQAFNLIFTAFPSFLLAIYDVEVPFSAISRVPRVYERGPLGQLFNVRVFWSAILNGVFQAAVCFFIPFWLFDPISSDLWLLGAMVFFLVCTVTNLNCGLLQASWHWSNILMMVLTLISWPVFGFIFQSDFFYTTWNTDFGRDWVGLFSVLVGRGDTWLVLIIAIAIANGRDYLSKSWTEAFFPRNVCVLHEQERYPDTKVNMRQNSLKSTFSLKMVKLASRNSSVRSVKEDIEMSKTGGLSAIAIGSEPAVDRVYHGGSFDADEDTEAGLANMVRNGSIAENVSIGGAPSKPSI